MSSLNMLKQHNSTIKKNLGVFVGLVSLLFIVGWILSFTSEGFQGKFVDFSISLTFVLIIGLGVAALALSFYRLILKGKKAIVKVAIVAVVSLLFFVIAYAMATDDLSTLINKNIKFTSSSLKMVGGLVGMTWALIATGVIGAIFAEVKKMIK